MCRAKLPPKRGIITRREGEAYRNGVKRCSKGKDKGGCKACVHLMSHHTEIVKEVKVYNTGQKIPVEGKFN